MVTRKSRTPAASGIESRRKAAQSTASPSYTAKRKEVVQAAAHVFKERGYDASTLNDVAETLGTDRASLYYYVGSKEELLDLVISEVLTKNLEAAQRVAKRKGTALEKVRALIEEMMLSFDENYPQMYVYVEGMSRIAHSESEAAHEVLEATRKFEAIVIDVLEKGKRDGSLRSDLPVDVCALALFGMVNWTHRWYKPGGQHSPREIADTFATLILDGYRCW